MTRRFRTPRSRRSSGRPAPFERVFAVKPIGRVTVTIDDRAELVLAHLVSGGFYEGVGIVPIAGRPILPSDDTRGRAETVGVISDGFWAQPLRPRSGGHRPNDPRATGCP